MSRVKIDECLPSECAELLREEGHDVETVHQEGLQGAPDLEVWITAQKEERFLITTDLDFSDTRRYKPGEHAGVLLLRLHKEGKLPILSYLQWLVTEYDISKWEGCFVIASNHKVRIKTPAL